MGERNLVNVETDLGNIRLGDHRLDRRCLSIVGALQNNPSASFTEALGSDAASEGFYRFLANPRVEWGTLLDEHRDSTYERAMPLGRVLAIHDTSMCQFGGDTVRQGAFRTSKGKSGFLAHTCLAVSADGARQPLGVLGMIPVVRFKVDDDDAVVAAAAAVAAAESPGWTYDNEAQRWSDLVGIVEDEKPDELDVVHVMDSEGDAYDLMEFMVSQDFEFIVRLCHDRRTLTETGDIARLLERLPDAKVRLSRSVPLARRKNSDKPVKSERHAPREERLATLDVCTTTVNILRPQGSKSYLAALHLNIVYVVERDPPKGESPVCWILATTQPVDTIEQVEAVVDAYRARWLIEEWFKALKSGCSYQKRQLGSLDTLLTAFSMLAPIATRLLCIRWFARNEPERPATDVLSEPELICLGLIEKRHRRRFPAKPTVRDAMFAIARIGGFLKQNKRPGWQTLGRGFEEFQSMFAMYEVMTGGGLEM